MQDPKDFYSSTADRTLPQLLSYMLHCQQVRRFHTEPMLQPPCIGQHSGGVARMCLLLTQGKASAALLARALYHDDGEQIMGDMPAPTKLAMDSGAREDYEHLEHGVILNNVTFFNSIEEITEEEERILKLADRMQGMLECVLEYNLGNKFMLRPFERLAQYALNTMQEGNAFELQIYCDLRSMFYGDNK